jgi:hypothetical protein
MKRYILILLLISAMLSPLFSIRDWKVFTNTTHIYDMVETNNKLYLATWGGLEVYDLASDSFERNYTTYDGLADLDIRSI